MQDNKCYYHDELKEDTARLADLVSSMLNCQAKFETQMENTNKILVETQATQKEIKKCLNDLALNLARNYVSKDEFRAFTVQSEDRIVRIHSRLDAADEEAKKNLWKVIGWAIPGGALIFGFISWLVSLILGV